MSPEVQVLLQPIVDVQPVWNLLAVVGNNSLLEPETLAYVRMKLGRQAEAFRLAAEAIDRKLCELGDEDE